MLGVQIPQWRGRAVGCKQKEAVSASNEAHHIRCSHTQLPKTKRLKLGRPHSPLFTDKALTRTPALGREAWEAHEGGELCEEAPGAQHPGAPSPCATRRGVGTAGPGATGRSDLARLWLARGDP